MDEDEEKSHDDWIDSENLDCQISEACQLYGIDKLEECNRDETNNKDDAESIESGKDEITLQDRVNSQLFIVRETESGQLIWKCSLQEADAVACHIDAANKTTYRLGCHSFR